MLEHNLNWTLISMHCFSKFQYVPVVFSIPTFLEKTNNFTAICLYWMGWISHTVLHSYHLHNDIKQL